MLSLICHVGYGYLRRNINSVCSYTVDGVEIMEGAMPPFLNHRTIVRILELTKHIFLRILVIVVC